MFRGLYDYYTTYVHDEGIIRNGDYMIIKLHGNETIY